jgi:hypothetical protein
MALKGCYERFMSISVPSESRVYPKMLLNEPPLPFRRERGDPPYPLKNHLLQMSKNLSASVFSEERGNPAFPNHYQGCMACNST